ncbi:MAG: PAS domain-containing sensor histidine kinase [Mariniblastus sp.]
MEPIDEIDLRYKTLHAIHESAADAIFSVNELGVVNTVNPAAECLFGYGKTELVGQDIFVLIPSLSCEQTERGLARVDELRAVAAGTGLELTALNKEGSSLFVDVTVREMRTDGEQSFAVFVRERAHSQYAGEQTESLGRIIEESFNETYILDALDLKFVFVNLAARNNLGYSSSELAEMTPVDINPSFSMDAFQELVKPLLQGATESLQFETEHVRKNGSPYEVMVNLQRSSFLSRSVFVATVLDVTEHKLAERRVNQQQAEMQDELKRQVALKTEELRRAQDQLMRSEKFSTLGKVAGGIAHEIRNPLNAVKTSAYFLLNAKNPSTEKVREHLERIDRQVSTVDNVITALADVAIMPEANLRPVAIEPLLRTVVSSLRLPEILDVVFSFEEGMPDVMVDERQIAIAFRNLIRNARDAMPDGGVLTIGSKVSALQVVFSIKDSGVGIASENLKNIIEPLFTTKARGMGLGLSITRAIVEKNQGSLSVESEIGVGSEFGISLNRGDLDEVRS